LWPDAVFPAADARIVAAHANVATQAYQVLTTTESIRLLTGATSTEGALQNGVECTFRVRANVFVDTNGNGAQDTGENFIADRKWVEGKATPMAVPAPPAAPVHPAVHASPPNPVSTAGNRVVQVDWTPPVVAAQAVITGGPITGYRVVLSSPLGAPVAEVSVGADTLTHTFSGLTNGWVYVAQIYAVNAAGESRAARTAEATPTEAPGVPRNVRVTASTTAPSTALKVAWSAPAANNTATVTGYNLFRRLTPAPGVDTAAWADTGATITGTMAEVTGLAAGTSYDFRVQASGTKSSDDSATTGVWSAAASGTPSARPAAVTNVQVDANDGSLTLMWTPAVSMGSKVTSYTVRYNLSEPDSHNPWRSAGSVAGSLLPHPVVVAHSFTARTRKVYSVPLVRPVISVVGRVGLPATTQAVAGSEPEGAPLATVLDEVYCTT